MPASCMALALTNAACPLACVSITGLSGDTLSREACSGKPSTLGSGAWSHLDWCQPRPMIHSPGLACLAARATWATISSQVRASRRSSPMRNWPTPVKWPWPSINPGTASMPCRSMTRVFGPIQVAASLSEPSAEMRSPRTARAWTTGAAEFIVTIFPLRRTRSAGCAKAAAAAAAIAGSREARIGTGYSGTVREAYATRNSWPMRSSATRSVRAPAAPCTRSIGSR